MTSCSRFVSARVDFDRNGASHCATKGAKLSGLPLRRYWLKWPLAIQIRPQLVSEAEFGGFDGLQPYVQNCAEFRSRHIPEEGPTPSSSPALGRFFALAISIQTSPDSKTEFNGIGGLRTYIRNCAGLLPPGTSKLRPQLPPRWGRFFGHCVMPGRRDEIDRRRFLRPSPTIWATQSRGILHRARSARANKRRAPITTRAKPRSQECATVSSILGTPQPSVARSVSSVSPATTPGEPPSVQRSALIAANSKARGHECHRGCVVGGREHNQLGKHSRGPASIRSELSKRQFNRSLLRLYLLPNCSSRE